MDAHERHFLSRYQKPITKFVSGIVQSRYDLIVAISRKAPRLLMLVDQFSNTPIVPWEKCVTEKALPFINATTLSGRRIVVVDDTLIFGSTLAGVMDELSLFNADVHSCVLTISRGAHSELARKVEASMKVREDEIAEFIDSEVQSFGSLGTPYDVDHPIIGITSPTPFEPMLADLKSRRDSMHDNTRRWHAASGVTVFNDDAMSEAKVHSLSSYQRGPCQIRIFIDGKQRHLNVVPIYCLSLTESEMLDTTLFDHSPRPLGVLWRSALQATANSPLHRTRRYQALMNAAHYLGSFEFGWRWITEVLKGIEIDTPSVAERDLRLIFGLDMCTGWQRELRSALAGEMPEPGLPTPEWRDTHRVEIESELLTLARTSSGSKFLSTVNRYLAHTTGAHARESLAAVLEAQRLVWDESTRSSGRLDSSRLDIALSYPAMKQLLELSGVRLTDALFHDCCNSSIDSGLIVPRYVRTTNDENRWVRGIRFGENLSHDHKIKYWLDYVLAQAIMCFKREHRDTAVDGIPWFVCEKLLATLQVGLSAELDNALSVEIALGFDEFGARTTLPEYPRQPFVIDWALETDLFQSDEKRGIRR